jgi:hypothetical protein
MATDKSTAGAAQDGATPAEQTASEVGAIVAEQVRRAIVSAESAAEELREGALEHAAAGHDQLDRAASHVLSRIDAIEAKVAGLLQGVRDDVGRIAEEAKRPRPEPPRDDAPSAAPQAGVAEPTPAAEQLPVSHAASAPAPVRRRRGGLFRRRPRAPQRCDVCARSAQPDEQGLSHWRQVARMSLCPECQAEGWQLPSGGTVPYRATRQRETG